MNLYAFFVATSREEYAEEFINKCIGNLIYKTYIPKFKRIPSDKRLTNLLSKKAIPGYVFVDSELQNDEFFYCSKVAVTCKDIYRLIKYEGVFEYAMRDLEKEEYYKLFGENFSIEPSYGSIEGDKVYITSGPLVNWNGHIKKINRHKREATVQLNVMGRLVDVVVSLEITSKC